MAVMRAKLVVSFIRQYTNGPEGDKTSEELTFNAVCANKFGPDGSDENNSYAKWTPMAELRMTVNNPALFDSFTLGQKFYVDFTEAK
jgi:hypothetical protein